MLYNIILFIIGSGFTVAGLIMYKIYQILTIEKDQNYNILKNKFLRKRNVIILKNDI